MRLKKVLLIVSTTKRGGRAEIQYTQESVYKMLLAFDKLFDKMSPEEKRKVNQIS